MSAPDTNSPGAGPGTTATGDLRTPVPAPVPDIDATEVAELARLRAEVTALRGRLDTRRRRASALTALRRIVAAVLVAVCAFALVASVVGLWAARTTLNTDRWVATIAPLPEDPQVAAAVADYATGQVFEVIDVEQRLRTVLPEQAAFIVGPITGQIRDAVEKNVYKLLQNDRFQAIWVEANRRAHQRALAIIEGRSEVATARQDRVDIDLLPLINQVLRDISAQLPTLFGKQITLPDLSSGEIPANLRERVEDALGVSLPADFAQFTIYDAGKLRVVQEAVATAKRDLVIFVVSTVALLVFALLISPRRRRTILQLGVWLVVAAVAVTAILRAVRSDLLQLVPEGLYRDGVGAALTVIFGSLRERGQQLIWIGAILALVAYLVGPGWGPVWLRRHLALGARAAGRGIRHGARVLAAHGPGWLARHLDVVRIAGVVVAAALALILSSWLSLLVIVLALVAFEVVVTLLVRSARRTATPAAETPVADVPAAVPAVVPADEGAVRSG